jgi:antitoxin component YwqK of YwqJK toxin-antitoxin module
LYILEKDGKKYISFDENPITLPTTGIYKLTATEIDEEYEINIRQNRNSDTLNLPSIQGFVEQTNASFTNKTSDSVRQKIRMSMSERYFDCGIVCNGYKVGKYSNGKIKFEGMFENGFPIGEFKMFYQNGKIKELSFYEKYALLKSRKEYDINGNLIAQ